MNLRLTRDRSERGFIIVAVLWILGALAVLVSIYAAYVANTAMASRVGDDRLQAQALIMAGLELTAYRLTSADDDKRPASGSFGFEMGRARVAVDFVSEGARIDLNLAKKELLIGLLQTVGIKSENAGPYADRIIGWRRKTDAGGRNEEVEAYQRAGRPYPPRQGPFQNVGELRLVLDLPAVVVDRILPYVTVFNGQAGIDVMVAPGQVVAALPDLSPAKVAEILEVRQRRETRAVMDLVGLARDSISIESRKASRVNIHMTFGNGRRMNAEVVILLLEDGPEPYRILAWDDDFDGLTAGPR